MRWEDMHVDLHKRLSKLRTVLASRQDRDLAWIVQWVRAGSKGADQRPPGSNQRGCAIEQVYEGDESVASSTPSPSPSTPAGKPPLSYPSLGVSTTIEPSTAFPFAPTPWPM